jgi:hypothetical protein
MGKNKKWIYIEFSLAAFLLGLVLMYLLYGRIDNFDTAHTSILIPIFCPLSGIIIGFTGIFKSEKYFKILCLLTVLLNLGLASLIFISYSFSYWQF